jgi:hypothetical protein
LFKVTQFYCIVFFLFLGVRTYSQSGNPASPGGSHSLADYYRRQELFTGTPSPTALLQQNYLQQFQLLDSLFLIKVKYTDKNSSIQFLPVTITTVYKTHHPYGLKEAQDTYDGVVKIYSIILNFWFYFPNSN